MDRRTSARREFRDVPPGRWCHAGIVRMFVLGAPCAGKSSVATRLRHCDVDVIDTDDEIERLNGGVWPDIETKNERLLPIVLDIAAALPEVVLFNSYMPLDRTRQLKDRGFAIPLLAASPSPFWTSPSASCAEETSFGFPRRVGATSNGSTGTSPSSPTTSTPD